MSAVSQDGVYVRVGRRRGLGPRAGRVRRPRGEGRVPVPVLRRRPRLGHGHRRRRRRFRRRERLGRRGRSRRLPSARAQPPEPAPSKVPPVPSKGAALREAREVLRGGRVQLGGSHDVGAGHLAARVRGRVRLVAGSRGTGSTSGVDAAPGGERGDSNARRAPAQAAVGDTKRGALREGVSELAAEPEPPGELGDEHARGDRDAGAGVARVVRRDARVALNAPLSARCLSKT
mmetsp:Transcript_1079/g.4015  ORF Transcript_1079/g.4015 Transcript_1079/m.4015 type:complete len:232 (-) Transcript_1079:1222-1917(-)